LRDDSVLLFDGAGHYRLSSLVATLPLNLAIATETEALVKTRRGQSRFRRSLEARWSGRCPLTDISEPALLRASHIVPWNQCEIEAERLEPDNGILLSALWDAAFDRRLVTFDDHGAAIACRGLTPAGLTVIKAGYRDRIKGLTVGNRERLRWHRAQCAVA